MSNEIISHFRERPKTRIAWWAMGLGLATFFIPPFLGIFAAFIRPLIDQAAGETTGMIMGFGGAICSLALSAAALATAIRAYRKGERSWVLWVGFIPAILIGTFWVFMVVGELLFPH
jgi:hypothetical protein